MIVNHMPLEIFYCYADADEHLLAELENHLLPLKRQYHLKTWHRGQMIGGTDRNQNITRHCDTASIILLLISAEFMASEDGYGLVERAMKRHERREAHVVPILLSHAYWKGTIFGHLTPLPRNSKPIKAWNNHDEALVNVVEGIKEVIEKRNKLSDHNGYQETDYTNNQEELSKKLERARAQATLATMSDPSPKYKIDKSFFVNFNLTDQEKKFKDLLKQQLGEQDYGISVCALSHRSSYMLRGYVLQRMISILENSNKRLSTKPFYEIRLESSDLTEGEKSIERKILSRLTLHHLVDLCTQNTGEDIVLVIWYDSCPLTEPVLQASARSFNEMLKTQIQQILCQQERCLLLLWIAVGEHALDESIALPPLENFNVEKSLIPWLSRRFGEQLKTQGETEISINQFLTKLAREISKWGGTPDFTYEALQNL